MEKVALLYDITGWQVVDTFRQRLDNTDRSIHKGKL